LFAFRWVRRFHIAHVVGGSADCWTAWLEYPIISCPKIDNLRNDGGTSKNYAVAVDTARTKQKVKMNIDNLNFEGGDFFQAAMQKVGATYAGSTYGGLILHIANQTTASKTEQMIQLSLTLIDDWTRTMIFKIIDDVSPQSTAATFWTKSLDEAVQHSGLIAFSLKKEHEVAATKEQFRELQNLLFNALAFNFVLIVLKSETSKVFVQKSIGIGFLGRLFS
jgi:hypothetical protein